MGRIQSAKLLHGERMPQLEFRPGAAVLRVIFMDRNAETPEAPSAMPGAFWNSGASHCKGTFRMCEALATRKSAVHSTLGARTAETTGEENYRP
jgi:hypothetical protein